MDEPILPLSPNEYNPVDYYNKYGIEDAFRLLLTIKAVERNSPMSLTFVKNSYDRKIKQIIFKDGLFMAKHENGLGMKVGEELTPFAMVQKFKHRGNFLTTLNYVIIKVMKNELPYVRVGTDYYKKIYKIDRNGVKRHELKVWKKETIVQDHDKDILDRIPSYDDFTIEPDNMNYREIIDNNYNLYSPFEHTPMKESEYKGELDWYWTKTLLEHIFGEQYELGLQYISTLYMLPKQKLPILVLVSEERSTGKTTFVDWLDILFGQNTVIINPQDISNQFNGSYSDKNIIIIEESKFENRGALEKLKNLSTQKKILVNAKWVSHYSIPFHGKLVITSNDENKFSKIDDTEIRYWIRKIPTLQGKANHNILNDLAREIPAFLHYLSTLEPIDTSKSRMVFTPEALNTEALETVKKESRSYLYKEIEILVDDFFTSYPEVPTLKVSLTDIKDKWFIHNHKIDRAFIKITLRDEFKMEPSKVQRYTPFETGTPSMNGVTKTGRPYIFINPYFKDNIDG